MTKLNQIIAIEAGVRGKAEKALTEAHRNLQKPGLLSGISRTYRPKDDEGEKLPPESTKMQLKAAEVIEGVVGELARLLDVTAAKDYTNTQAMADVVVDGQVLVKDAPTTYLLFLEKKLVDIATFIRGLPVLDPAEEWEPDPNTGAYRSKAVETIRTRKVPRNWVKAEATDKHPAQVEIFHEDVLVGYWTTVKFSGALPQTTVNAMAERVEKLQEAVKFARETANQQEVSDPKPGKAVLNYLFGGIV